MKSLYQKRQWLELLKFVRKKYIVHIHLDNQRKDCKKFPIGSAIADAHAFLRCFQKYVNTNDDTELKNFRYNPKGKHVISIIHNKKEPYEVLSTCIIHEYGHALMYSKYTENQLKRMGLVRREVMAWSLGKKSVSSHLIPPEYVFSYVKEKALSSYTY